MNQSCGYSGSNHYCADGRVAFISRYRLSNDYCVSGRRVSISDAGDVRNAEPGDVGAIYAFEWAKYQDYLKWRETCGIAALEVLPFDAGVRFAMQRANYAPFYTGVRP